METTFWRRQETGKPLYPDLAWSRPQNRQQGGKLLIVGGNLYSFTAPAKAYTESQKADIGVCRIALPDSIRRIVGPATTNSEFFSSTPSGSFSVKALPELLDLYGWADGVILAGDFGRNSETAILIEKLLANSSILTVITQDTADYITSSPDVMLSRPSTALVLSLSQLQKLAVASKFEQPITFSMDITRLVNWLHNFTLRYDVYIVVKHLDKIFVGAHGKVSSTKLEQEENVWRVKTAAHLVAWWIQTINKPFEAMTAGIYELYCRKEG